MIRISVLLLAAFLPTWSFGQSAAKPNILLILADDLGFSDLGCYGSEIATPNLDRLASGGLRFTQFYNAARCCPTRAALLTGLYPHQTGVGHMLQDWGRPAYAAGLNEHCATIAELLRPAGYGTYHVGKWHVGGVGEKGGARNHPLNRGFEHAFGTAGGGDHFNLKPLYLDHESVDADEQFYASDAFSTQAVRFIDAHRRERSGDPFFLQLCYIAPHFPLQAKPHDIDKYRGRYRVGWDAIRERRFARQKQLGIVDQQWQLSPRDPIAQAWSDVPETEKDEWDLRMAVHAAMIDCMDQGIGTVLEAVRRTGAEQNTIVLFLSDNGASAEFLDTWPSPARGHRPGSETGTPESHHCLEVGWANAANTPFREHKMWAYEGGIATPLVVSWPAGITERGALRTNVGHVVDLMPTFLQLAETEYPKRLAGRELTPLAGESLVPALRGKPGNERMLAWEHEGNRAIRVGDWKLVASYGSDWELYDLKNDRTEVNNVASQHSDRVRDLTQAWQQWADKVGVVPWSELPGANYKPTPGYRKKSEPVEAD